MASGLSQQSPAAVSDQSRQADNRLATSRPRASVAASSALFRRVTTRGLRLAAAEAAKLGAHSCGERRRRAARRPSAATGRRRRPLRDARARPRSACRSRRARRPVRSSSHARHLRFVGGEGLERPPPAAVRLDEHVVGQTIPAQTVDGSGRQADHLAFMAGRARGGGHAALGESRPQAPGQHVVVPVHDRGPETLELTQLSWPVVVVAITLQPAAASSRASWRSAVVLPPAPTRATSSRRPKPREAVSVGCPPQSPMTAMPASPSTP